MNTDRRSFLENLRLHFHEREEDLDKYFNPGSKQRVMRLRTIYQEIKSNPMESDSRRVRWIMERFGLKERQAHYDLMDLRIALGTALHFDKAFERYELAQGLREMMTVARARGDYRSYASLAEKYDELLRLSKDDPEEVNKELVPMSVEPTDDVRVLGINPPAEGETALKKRIRERLGGMVEDVDFDTVLATKTPDPFNSHFYKKMKIEGEAVDDDYNPESE